MKVAEYTVNNCPEFLQKKVAILEHFKTYLLKEASKHVIYFAVFNKINIYLRMTSPMN